MTTERGTPHGPLALRLVRLLTFSAVASLALVAWLYGSLKAERSIVARGVDGAGMPQGINEMNVNGQRFLVATGHTKRPLSELFDSFESQCRPGTPDLLNWTRSLNDPGPIERSEDGNEYPNNRVDDGEQGYTSCLYLGRQAPEDATAALREIFARRRLPLGVQSRYLYGRSSAPGSFYALVWNPGELDLGAMTAEEGDVAGFDVAAIPRPRGSRRVAHSAAPGFPYSMATFESTGASVEVLKEGYESALEKSNWETYDTDSNSLAVRRGDRLVWLIFDETSSPGTVLTTMVDSGEGQSFDLGKAKQ